jgi:flagellar biosynthesis protein FliQ
VTEDTAIDLGVDALIVSLKIALPILLVALLVGFAISIFQAVTQIQEMTLTFIPKILAMVLVLIVAGPWMLDQIVAYTQDLWGSIPAKAGP